MKSVALTEGKKAYFYDLNRQPGIKRNFSPRSDMQLGCSRQPGMLGVVQTLAPEAMGMWLQVPGV